MIGRRIKHFQLILFRLGKLAFVEYYAALYQLSLEKGYVEQIEIIAHCGGKTCGLTCYGAIGNNSRYIPHLIGYRGGII